MKYIYFSIFLSNFPVFPICSPPNLSSSLQQKIIITLHSTLSTVISFLIRSRAWGTPLHCGILTGCTLCLSCAGNHNLCKFGCMMAMSFRGQHFTSLLLVTFIFFIPFTTAFFFQSLSAFYILQLKNQPLTTYPDLSIAFHITLNSVTLATYSDFHFCSFTLYSPRGYLLRTSSVNLGQLEPERPECDDLGNI